MHSADSSDLSEKYMEIHVSPPSLPVSVQVLAACQSLGLGLVWVLKPAAVAWLIMLP